MKILHVIDKMDPKRGGVCQAVRTMIKGLSSYDIHNEVVCLDNPNEAFLKEDGFTTHTLGPADNPWCYSKKLMPWLLNNLPGYTVVIVHGLWQYPGYAVFKAKGKLFGKDKSLSKQMPRFLVMPHGMLDPYFQNAPDRKIKALRNVLYWKLIERKVVNKAHGLLFTCEEEARLARQPFRPYNPKKELVVGLGVEQPPIFEMDMKDAFLKKCPELQGDSYFLFLSRIHEKKGVLILLDAYSKLLEKWAETGKEFNTLPKLVIAGPGIDSDYGKLVLQAVSSKLILENQVLFPGMLTGQVKWGAFYGCEAFVLPSHQENFGIAIVEALACGKPVLISNKINIWREIAENRGGLVSEDDLSGTLQILETWTQMNTAEKSTMGENAKRIYQELYSVDNAAENLLKAI